VRCQIQETVVSYRSLRTQYNTFHLELQTKSGDKGGIE
jgi:hypothetical protein